MKSNCHIWTELYLILGCTMLKTKNGPQNQKSVLVLEVVLKSKINEKQSNLWEIVLWVLQI